MFENVRKKAHLLQEIMESMGEGLDGITIAMDESAHGMVDVAKNTGNLAEKVDGITKEAEKNLRISNSLRDEVERFRII